MPLFHSNSIYAGWGVALVTGAAIVPAVFSVSRFLDDVRRYGVTFMNYVGKPLAYILSTPEKPDDHDNPLRVAFGNEASDRDIAEFARRFDCTVWDGFGSTENAVIITREDGCPDGSLGKGFPGVAIYDPETLQECEVATFDDSGDLLNREAAVGELVNTSGGGLFRGYYKDAGATDHRLRHGMYWSGDLAYRDADGWIYFAGRTADWMRVDGENLAAAPIERVLIRLPEISRVAVYPVPDESVGDQVMAAIVLRDGATLTPEAFEEFLGAPGRPVAEGVAALRLDRRRSAVDGDQQDPQAGVGLLRHDSAGWPAVEARRSAVRIGDVAQRHQRRAQFVIGLGAQVGSPFGLDLRDLGGRCGAQLFAPIGEHDQAGPRVGRVGFARDVAVGLQVVDERARGLLGHSGLLGKVGDADPFAVQPLADAALGEGQIVEAGGPHGFEHPGFGGAMCNEHQQRGGRFVAHPSSIG